MDTSATGTRLVRLFTLAAVFLSFNPLAHGKINSRLNHMQVLTSLQSNHVPPPPKLFEYLKTTPADAALNTEAFRIKIGYTQTTLTEQLNKGYRGLEFNLHTDYEGGAYQYSALYKLAGLDADLSKKYPQLMKPGFKSFKTVDLDPESTCILFEDCITEILAWSEAHKGHLPITIVLHPGDERPLSAMFNLDSDPCFGCPGLPTVSDGPSPHFLGPYTGNCVCNCTDCTTATFYNEQVLAKLLVGPPPNTYTNPMPVLFEGDLAAVESLISTLVPMDKLLTPADLLAWTPGAKTLKQAVFPPSGQWPKISKVRNKLIFVVDPGYMPYYSNLHPNLQGAIMFPSVDADNLTLLVESDPTESIVFLDILGDNLADKKSKADPPSLLAESDSMVSDTASLVKTAVSQGYIVRSQLDKNFLEPFHNYTFRAQQFVKAGPQYAGTLVTTPPFFPTTYSAFPSDYFPPGKVAVCNPITTYSKKGGPPSAIPFLDGFCTAAANPDGEPCIPPALCSHINERKTM